MRLHVRIFGVDLLDVELTTDAPVESDEDDDCSRDLSGGTTYASPMGFTAHMEKPHEVETPDRDW
jgi:hypothetical protein